MIWGWGSISHRDLDALRSTFDKCQRDRIKDQGGRTGLQHALCWRSLMDKGLTGNVVWGPQIPVRSLKITSTETYPLVFILS